MKDWHEPIKVTILDTLTKETRVVDDISHFQWAEHNWSCDCNRMSYFDVESKDEEGVCFGCHRFIIIDNDQNIPLEELNSDYPIELYQEYIK